MLKTQFISPQFFRGEFVTENQLADALLTMPYLDEVLTYAMFNEGKSNSYLLLQGLTKALGNVGVPGQGIKYIGSDQYMWFLQVDGMRSVPIVGPSSPPPDANVGINFSNFVLPLAERYFGIGDTLFLGGGAIDSVYVRVMEEPYRQGNAWCYTLQILGNDPNQFVNPKYLQIGKEVSWVGTAFEEGSEGGNMKSSTYMGFKNQFGIYRMAAGMTGSAAATKLIFRIETNKGRKDLWLYKQQYDLLVQFHKMLEHEYWHSRYNRLSDDTIANIGASGRVVRRGSGIEEQILGSNTYVTDRLSEELLRHILFDVMRNEGRFSTNNRVLITGTGGLIEFHNAMKEAMVGTVAMVDGALFVHKRTGNELAFGAQFTTYKGFLGQNLVVAFHPMFDDRTLYPELHPVTGLTMQSYKMYFLNFGDVDGEPNIQVVARGVDGYRRGLIQWFSAGSTTPNFNGDTGTKMLSAANGFDGFMCYVLSESGVMIRNPLSCACILLRPSLDFNPVPAPAALPGPAPVPAP